MQTISNSGPGPVITAKKRLQPLVALRGLRELIRDPEKTEQVFIIIKAMSGNALENAYRKFALTQTGQAILAEKRQLLTTLLDRDSLREQAVGSLASHYLRFVETEQISADGLVEASQQDDNWRDEGLRLFGERMRDQHDLWHVVTGYGRDTFGEACLLAFTYAQTQNRGIGIIAFVGMLKLTKALGSGVKTAMWQAYKDGKKAAWLPAQDWETLLTENIDQVREKLNIGPPQKYQEVFSAYQLSNA